MGVAKSLRKAGNLKEAGDGINNLVNYFDKKKKEKERQDFINNVIGLYDQHSAGLEKAKQDVELKEGGNINVLSPENFTSPITGKKPGMNLDVKIPESVNQPFGIKDSIPMTEKPNQNNYSGSGLENSKEFEKRFDQPEKFIQNTDGTKSTHKMASGEVDGKYIAFPTIVNINGQLKELPMKDAIQFAIKNKEYKEFSTDAEAKAYANNGYKKGTSLEPDQFLFKNTLQSLQKNDMAPVPPETQTNQRTPEQKYSDAQKNYGEFEKKLAPMIMNPNIDESSLSRVNVLSNIARNQTETLRPKEKKIGTFNPEHDVVDENTGNIIRKGKKTDSSTDGKKKDFKVSEDGYYMYWDDMVGDGNGDWVKTSQKAPKEKGEQSAAWARLFYDMTKDKEEESGKKKENQGKYNAIMGSKFLTTEELLDQKIITSDDPQAKKYGGAYVVRDDKDYKNYKVLYTDKELEDYAKNQVSDTPNKWERTDPAGIKDKETDPLGIR